MNEIDINVLIRQAVEDLGIDQPIMTYKVVGSRLELHMLGGSTATYKVPGQEDTSKPKKDTSKPTKETSEPPSSSEPYAFFLRTMTLKQLKEEAKKVQLPNRSKFKNRKMLIAALTAFDKEDSKDA